MHSLIEIGEVVLDKKRTFRNFRYYLIKIVLLPFSEEGCGYMN